MVFLVDTDGNGETDHFVTIVGYRDDGVQQYCCLDTWFPYDVVRWCNFATMQDEQPWGIYGGWTFRLAPEKDIVNLEDFSVLSSGWLTAFNADDLAIMALQWLIEGSDEIEWVFIDNDPGVFGHEPFDGYMSKYETTNAQYCQFLNAALASGDIAFDIADPNIVVGASGSNSGADFASEAYYDLDGPGQGATDKGAARINYTGSSFTVDIGFEKHPVNYVSWYGATAFCNYYGYRLPTEWEWQAVADFDGSYIYGCGPSINNTIANYLGSAHPDGTTAVGYFGTYGYGMCDMSGNLWEWTSTVNGNYRRIRDGCCWYNVANTISLSSQYSPYYTNNFIGFRVCR